MNVNKLIIKITENWPAKVLSVALAIILFVFHRMNTLTTRPISVPLAIETGSTMTPASSYPQSVRVNLRGEDDDIKSIADSDIEAYVDFSRYESEGLYRAPVQIRKKGTALEVEPLEISVSPMEISLRVDRKISKTLPLTAAVRGRVAPGYDLVSYSVSPPDAVITGPLGILEPFLELETEPVELEGKNADFTVPVNIVVPNPLFVLRGNGTAEFQGHVRPAIPVRNFEGLPIVITGLDPRFTADTVERRGSVRLEGGQSQLESFKPPDGFLSVDCSGLSRPGTYTLPVLISLPGGFYLIRQEPEELVLIISLKEESP